MKRLRLKRETVRRLTGADLARAIGGEINWSVDICVASTKCVPTRVTCPSVEPSLCGTGEDFR